MLPDRQNITTDMLQGELMLQNQVSLSVLRLDAIHPVISGNKLFKLSYYLEDIIDTSKTVITFGGAFSNHLVATAYACKIKQLPCTGIVRGEKTTALSPTLVNCLEYGMQLYFISREEYQKKESGDTFRKLIDQHPGCIVIPEGGYGLPGAKGAAQIMDLIDGSTTHTCCAIGTATTVAGLLLNAQPHQKIVGIPVLKGLTDIDERINFLNGKENNLQQLHIDHNYHFGGYAKKTGSLIRFMNELYDQYSLPTDFVYTAKMMYAVIDMIKNGFFEKGSRITCIHTGGLQGNASLQKGTLTFN